MALYAKIFQKTQFHTLVKDVAHAPKTSSQPTGDGLSSTTIEEVISLCTM